MRFPKKLIQKISSRKEDTSLRSLGTGTHLIDFSSNDYLGYAKSGLIFDKTHQFLIDKNIKQNGATGSRLLSGNHKLYISVEKKITEFLIEIESQLKSQPVNDGMCQTTTKHAFSKTKKTEVFDWSMFDKLKPS